MTSGAYNEERTLRSSGGTLLHRNRITRIFAEICQAVAPQRRANANRCTNVSSQEPPKVFWSWQSDFSSATCRTFVRAALVEAIEQINAEMDVNDADRPEVDHDTKGERGMVDIASTILTKIANAAVFVADLTPIAQSSAGKWLPNPNVMIELGWAMQKPGWERVIGVLNTASGAEIEDLPFDIRQRRVITYVLADGADATTRKSVNKKLVRELKGALEVTSPRGPNKSPWTR
ncbi:hypothetical protein GGQ73_004710 [Rhizobium skierniewicense]|uniref:CD-NTase-associated protein 12/Pycsar effector protein TIR domain-containing protein n=1 Tax=Rhizobium skierniewicense TaxID=984260 RepID=A0A7W6CAM1_9HYPH|nr:hypothetical protein [Rhizobium skierniewicense]MBB3948715.1 hypothetical protein [Rhizobium skierniewicense]